MVKHKHLIENKKDVHTCAYVHILGSVTHSYWKISVLHLGSTKDSRLSVQLASVEVYFTIIAILLLLTIWSDQSDMPVNLI